MEKDRKLARLVRSRVIGVTLLFTIAASVVIWFRVRDPLYASPTAEREDTRVLFARTWEQYTTETPPKTPNLPTFPPDKATATYDPKGVLVNLRGANTIDEMVSTPVTALHADETGVVQLPGGGQLRLAGYALHVPQAGGGTYQDTLQFLRPDTLQPLTANELDELGVSREARETPAPSPNFFPLLRMILVSEDIPFRRVGVWRVFDDRTHAMVTGAIDLAEDAQAFVMDAYLNIWHDTPVVVALELPCGDPQRISVPIDEGAFEEEIGNQIHFELVAVDEGQVRKMEKRGMAYYLQTKPDEPVPDVKSGTVLIYRISPLIWSHHCAFEVQSQTGVQEQALLREFEVAWADVSLPKAEIKEVSLVFLPERARVFFSIAGLPGMPNSRKTRNLFDVTIPQVVIPEEAISGDSVLPFMLMDIVASATQTSLDPMTASPMVQIPEEDVSALRYVDVTPRELVEEYRKYVVDPYLRVNRSDLSLQFHRPEPWDHRLRQWWYLHAPDWLQ